MKKLLITLLITTFSLTSLKAQNSFNIGLNAGLPIGLNHIYESNVTLDINYLFKINKKLNLGFTTGYSYSFGKKNNKTGLDNINYDDMSFLPVSVAGRYAITNKFTFGIDLGYAFNANNTNIISSSGEKFDSNGGLYFKPMIGYNISEKIMLQASYTRIILNGENFSTVNVGIMYKF